MVNVEAGGGFIQEQGFGFLSQHAGNQHALKFPAR